MHKLSPASYEEFQRTFRVDVPERYNFVYDFLDKVAAQDPGRKAMIHVDPDGVRREFDYAHFRDASNRLADALKKRGIGRGDRVMVILYRRVEYWETMLALHRIGAIPIPSPSLLTPKDIKERVGFAKVSCGLWYSDYLDAR